MIRLSTFTGFIYHILPREKVKLPAVTSGRGKKKKEKDFRYKKTGRISIAKNYPSNKGLSAREDTISNIANLSNIRLDINTGQLPVPYGISKFMDIYYKTVNPII